MVNVIGNVTLKNILKNINLQLFKISLFPHIYLYFSKKIFFK